MANFTVPADWELDGSTGNSQVVYIKTPDHTVTENFQVVFDRKVPQSVNGRFTSPEYRVRVRRTFVDADGVPMSAVALADLTIRWPQAADAADVKAMITELKDILTDAEFNSDVVDSLRLPR